MLPIIARREIYVGMPTVKAIVGDKMIPGLLDHYLASGGFKSQQDRWSGGSQSA